MEQLENANFGKLDINNYIGTKVNMLTLMSKSETKSKNGAYKWNCLCDCGNKVDVQPGHFVRKSLFSCGCKSYNFVDISGKRYGKWFVLGGHELRQVSKKSKSSFWKCVCDCGTFNVISANALEFGRSKSCGCARLEID